MHNSLRFLDLSHNQIIMFPTQLLKFPNLQTLLLDHNRISKFAQIPSTDRRVVSKSLRILSFHHNQVDSLPDIFFGLCSGLAELWMHNNMLTNLPLNTSMLVDLQTLTLSSNRLRQLPDVFNQLTSLKELWIQQNPLADVPQSIVQRKIHIFLHSLGGSALHHDS
jgi:Leucine-rich repeat (LRR) protein